MKHSKINRKKCWIHEFATPLGRTIAAVTPDTDGRDALIRLSFLSGDHTSDDVIQELVAQGYSPEWNEEALDDLEKQLGEYFRGTRKSFDILRVGGAVADSVRRDDQLYGVGEAGGKSEVVASGGRGEWK
jgi:hypothetical protein